MKLAQYFPETWITSCRVLWKLLCILMSEWSIHNICCALIRWFATINCTVWRHLHLFYPLCCHCQPHVFLLLSSVCNNWFKTPLAFGHIAKKPIACRSAALVFRCLMITALVVLCLWLQSRLLSVSVIDWNIRLSFFFRWGEPSFPVRLKWGWIVSLSNSGSSIRA